MTKWSTIAERFIVEAEDMRVMSIADLLHVFEDSVSKAGLKSPPTPRTFRRWVERISSDENPRRLISKIHRDLYQTEVPGRYLHPNEVASHIRNTAVVSLQSVLGEIGVINNPSRIVFSVINAADTDATRKRVEINKVGEYRFLAMRPSVYEAGDRSDRLDPNSRYPKATPERALCDWIYFAKSKAHETKHYPPLDADLDGLDVDRLHRLADAMGIRSALQQWLDRKATADDDESFAEQVSTRFGF